MYSGKIFSKFSENAHSHHLHHFILPQCPNRYLFTFSKWAYDILIAQLLFNAQSGHRKIHPDRNFHWCIIPITMSFPHKIPINQIPVSSKLIIIKSPQREREQGLIERLQEGMLLHRNA
jgi:hypothetical protein